MSKPKHGLEAIDAAVRDVQAEAVADRVAELRQLDLLDPVTPEDLLEAKQELGPNVGRIALLAAAREKKRGRPPGASNRRNDDFVRYLSQFGTDPAVGAMVLQSTPVEVLMDLYGGKAIEWIDRQLRCRELLMPYFHSKKPVAIDATIRGIRVVEEIGAPDVAARAIEGEYRRIAGADEFGGEDPA